MKRVIISVAIFAFALALGAGSSILLADQAAAEQCVNDPGVIYVETTQTCWISKYVQGHVVLVYDGVTDVTQTPCIYLYSLCLPGDDPIPVFPVHSGIE